MKHGATEKFIMENRDRNFMENRERTNNLNKPVVVYQPVAPFITKTDK